MSIDELKLQDATVEPSEAEAARAADDAPLDPVFLTAAAFLATAAAAWTVGGLFAGVMPRIVALVAAAIGAAMPGLSPRTKRPVLWQSLTLPVIAIFALVLATVGGVSQDGLGQAVRDAIGGGGPSGEAIPFDAGWRLLIVLFIGMLGAAASAIAVSTGRARLAVLVPVPAMILATLVQPKGATLIAGIPAMALVLGALAAAYGVELSSEGASSGKFETRRLGRGVVAMAGVSLFLFGISQAGFLFPIPDRERVIPPQLPPVVPPAADRELFTVEAPHSGPWRLGVLDVYDGRAWRLPPYDPARFEPLGVGGTVPRARSSEETVDVTFNISGLSGPVLPSPANPSRVTAADATYDPRTQMLRIPGRKVEAGSSYTVTGPRAPTGKELSDAPTPSEAMAEFMAVPAPPAEVTALLADAPEAPLWDRLQFARTHYYRRVIASGSGQPTAVPPQRVGAMLTGKPASPYELTAAEALLARWVGVPSRIGYGFFEGDRKGRTFSVRPRHAATWLEVHFEGLGWVPVVGVPPRAQSSLDTNRDRNPRIQPTEQLALVLYVPVQLQSIRLLYVIARFWVLVSLPFIVFALLLWSFYPGALKMARSARRRRWARKAGDRARIAVAYAELRDVATDLNIGESTMTPFEFSAVVASDDELAELTWLVSRALWGDLQRDLRPEDVEAAETMARSVSKRLRRAQPGPTRLLAVSSRASLRDPYTREVPGIWVPKRRSRRRTLMRAVKRAARSLRRRLRIGVTMLALLSLIACGSGADLGRSDDPSLPARIVPEQIGDVAFRHEPAVEKRLAEAGEESLIEAARVHTFLQDGTVQGYLEVGAFRPGARATQREVRRGVINGIGGASFRLTRAGSLRLYVARAETRDFVLWFAPDGSYFELLVARRSFGDPVELLARILEFQGNRVGSIDGGRRTIAPADPRRGLPT